MERQVMKQLIEWKEDKNRKPLILRGARQVGKTWLLKEFGKRCYQDVAYFNLDYDVNVREFFQTTKDVQRIIEQLTFVNKKAINKETTLIIFDEIQECPEALNTLKYFCENEPEYHVACAGSLLGVRMAKTSFPVGKVDFIDVYPLTFNEYLLANNCENLVEYLNSINKIEKIPDIFFNQLQEKLKAYLIIGGMPEVVKTWIEDKDILKVEKVQNAILDAYDSDFSKHTQKHEANKINLIWKSIPSQLAKENKKFLYQAVKEGARAREYEDALNWLDNANIARKVYRAKENALPLNGYDDLSAFKIYYNDVGLLSRASRLDSKVFAEGENIFKEFKGSLTENYVLEMLISKFRDTPKYYTFGNYEIDFLIQHKNKIIPIEVKSSNSKHNISLTKYNEIYNPKYRIRFSTNQLNRDGNLINIPLFMVEYLDKIIEIAEGE